MKKIILLLFSFLLVSCSLFASELKDQTSVKIQQDVTFNFSKQDIEIKYNKVHPKIMGVIRFNNVINVRSLSGVISKYVDGGQYTISNFNKDSLGTRIFKV